MALSGVLTLAHALTESMYNLFQTFNWVFLIVVESLISE